MRRQGGQCRLQLGRSDHIGGDKLAQAILIVEIAGLHDHHGIGIIQAHQTRIFVDQIVPQHAQGTIQAGGAAIQLENDFVEILAAFAGNAVNPCQQSERLIDPAFKRAIMRRGRYFLHAASCAEPG